MRGVLSRIGPRYAIVLGIVVAVAIVLVIARVGSRPTGSLVQNGADNGLVPSASAVPDDGAPSVPAPQPPSTSPGTPTPQALATVFAAAWVHTAGVTAAGWRTSLRALSTDRLDAELANANPQTVPAYRVTGTPSLTDRATSFVQASIPTDAGTLVLSLLATHGRWQVDAIDWESG